jgi:hypothetical protein
MMIVREPEAHMRHTAGPRRLNVSDESRVHPQSKDRGEDDGSDKVLRFGGKTTTDGRKFAC